jgi:hypothetical protein
VSLQNIDLACNPYASDSKSSDTKNHPLIDLHTQTQGVPSSKICDVGIFLS